MAASYLNEHSAEFVLVPQFGNILGMHHRQVILIHFWSSREGGSVSRKCMLNRPVRIVALFARRPKIDVPFQSFVEVKFNERLFHAARFLEDNHIPVFAGVPLASSLDDFHFSTICAWFRLSGNGQEEILKISVHDELMGTPRGVTKLDPTDILQVVEETCRPLPWEEAIDCFRELKHNIANGYSRHSFWGDPYKPVYFLLPELTPGGGKIFDAVRIRADSFPKSQ